jgi:hypothetical protein
MMPQFTVEVIPAEATAHGTHVIAVAKYICAPPTIGYSVPVTFDCALACTAIGWPMQMGILTIDFYTDDPTCPSAGVSRSKYFPQMVTMGLGCRPGNPSPEGIWQGEYFSSVTLISGPPAYGMSFRIRAVMTVNVDASVSVFITIDRLVPNSEFVPPPANGSNVYVECGNFSTTLTRLIDPSADPLARNVSWVMTNPNQVSFNTGGGYCETDIRSANATVVLMPYKLGCDGRANAGTQSNCALDTGYRTYSCMAVLIKPSTAGAFRPQWSQMGVNTGDDRRCFEGNNAGPSATPFAISAQLSPPPIYPDLMELLNCSCPNENAVISDKQQIQFTRCAGFDVVLKSVNKSDPCLAVRPSGNGNPWQIGAYTVDSVVKAQTGHWIATCSFPTMAGAPNVVIYGLEFPTGILAECVPIPSLGEQVFSMPPIVPPSAKELMAKINKVKELPCIHLGQQLETTPSCGCSGGNLYECAKHGKCRVQGNTIEMNCWRCPDYIDRTENNGMIDVNNGG